MTAHESGAGLAYRPEIDGLRAVAVLQVVLYHACALPRSGFVGVDVFFVISGYLITLLLLREHDATGRIDLVAFYARRVRRIFPAALLVIVATLAICAALLPAQAFRAAAQSAAAAAVFAANLFFQFFSGGYFDARAEELPLLHLWSLAVEEQFYFVWPVVLILLLRRSRQRLLPALAALALASFVLAEVLLRFDAQAAFYQTPARFWELAAGGLVAATAPRRAPPAVLLGCGAALLLAAAFLPLAHFPGAGALPAVAATALLLYAVHAQVSAGAVLAALRWTPLVGIGRISYSLYLWHWPLLAVYSATHIGGGDTGVRLALCAVAVLLATASYRYVEQPLRQRRASAGLLLAGSAAAVLVAALALLAAQRTPPEVLPDANEQLARRVENDLPPDWRRCHYQVASSDFPRPGCASRNDVAPTIAIWGDSMAMSWKALAWEFAAATDSAAIAYTRDACAPLLDYLADPAMPADFKCRDFNRQVLQQLDGMRTLILVLRLGDEASAHKAALLGPTLAQASRRVGRVLVLGPSPELRDAVPKCLRAAQLSACAVPRAEFERRAAPVLAELRAQAAPFPNVQIVDVGDFFCDATQCPGMRAGNPLYWDSHHVAASAAAAFARTHAELAQPATP